MQRMKEILDEVIKAKGMKRRIEMGMAIIKWPEVVGEVGSKFSQATRIKDGKLTVIVSNSVLLTDMRLRKEEYIERYEEILGGGIVRDIEFKLGVIKRPEPREEVEENPLYGDISHIELTDEELAMAEEVAQGVEEEETREVIKRAFIGQLKLNKWRRSLHGRDQIHGRGHPGS